MSGYHRWKDIRAEHVARAGGEAAVEAGKQELVNEMLGHQLAEVRRTRSSSRKLPIGWASPKAISLNEA